MPEKEISPLVAAYQRMISPAAELSQRLNDLEVQRVARAYYQEPQSVEALDIINAAKIAGPMPTLYNVNTGAWQEVSPYQARTLGVPVGPSNPAVLNRMQSGEIGQPLPLYGSDLIRT